jgi:hypothetical protein
LFSPPSFLSVQFSGGRVRVRDVLTEKSKTDPKMECRQLAVDHWRYVEGVLLRHGVIAVDVPQIGEAWLAGFMRGWSLAWYSRLFGVDAGTAAEWEWWRWASSRAGYTAECEAHFGEAFVHGWKHRIEVGAK